MEFSKLDTIYYYNAEKSYDKSIGFDLDYTIIKPKSGKIFPVSFDDYIFIENMKDILNALKYNIVIFTNQLKFTPEFLEKIKLIRKDLGIDFSIFISTSDDKYRKPNIFMYDFYKTLNKDDYEIVKYVGDACGRINDHSFCDIYFARNIGIDFETPETFMTNIYPSGVFKIDPYDLFLKYIHNEPLMINFMEKLQNKKTCIFLCGFPASTKSTFCQNQKHFDIVNQDKLKTSTKVKDAIRCLVKENKNFIVDKMFMKLEDRNEYMTFLKSLENSDSYYKVCIYFNVPMFICRHLNYERHIYKNMPYVSDIVYRTQNKHFKMPTMDEGFNEIFTYNPDIKIGYRLIDSIQKSELL